MPRKSIQKFLPTHRSLLENRWLRPFRALLHDPALVASHRRSVARGLAVGLFWAFMPVPLQSVFAVATAIWLRVNVLVAFAACWIMNPFTVVPIIYAAHALGALLLGAPTSPPDAVSAVAPASGTLLEMWAQFKALGEATLLGAVTLAIGSATLGFAALNGFWLWSVRRRFARRPGGNVGVVRPGPDRP